ncbi:hypothetical protein D0866_11431 [Hortaea werneckii]|uniref:Poly(A) RNA polymerase mitochondrial-like central palm domain-containing protein n=1 Tax=Hortaea werneckii TaxID=91943 RepID=A0A3M7A9Y1_HORWE|nr:hypothetical protein D0866_11431 [Hortaea werneckii]
MHSSRSVLRQSCRAQNAYNVATALRCTFTTTTRLWQDSSAARDSRSRGEGKATGSYSSYEALAEKFSGEARPSPQRRPTSGAKRQQAQSVGKESLLAQQAFIDGTWSAPLPYEETDGHTGERPAEKPLEQSLLSRKQMRKRGRRPGHNVSSRDDSAQDIEENTRTASDAARAAEPEGTHKTAADSWKEEMQWIGESVDIISRNRIPLEDVDKETLARIDYEPIVMKPAESISERAVPIPWAQGLSEAREPSAMDRLDSEINAFAAYISPTTAESAAREAIASRTRRFITKTLGRSKREIRTDVFGSEQTGLVLAHSDIDIRVSDSKWTQEDSQPKFGTYYSFGKIMKPLADRMMHSPEWICVSFRHSAFPIINAQHRESGIDVQIVCAPPTTPQQERTAKYMNEMPNLKALYSVLRVMFGVRGLVDVFNGGIGSYGLFMMLVAALKRGERSRKPPVTVGEQLMHFLKFYAHFDMQKRGLTLSPVAKPFLKHDVKDTPLIPYIAAANARGDPVRAGQWAIGRLRPLQPYLLSLQDPAKPTNDLGRKSNAMKHIQETIAELNVAMQENIAAVEVARARGSAWEGESLLEPLVGRAHEIFAVRRQRVEDWGKASAQAESSKSERQMAQAPSSQQDGVQNGEEIAQAS